MTEHRQTRPTVNTADTDGCDPPTKGVPKCARGCGNMANVRGLCALCADDRIRELEAELALHQEHAEKQAWCLQRREATIKRVRDYCEYRKQCSPCSRDVLGLLDPTTEGSDECDCDPSGVVHIQCPVHGSIPPDTNTADGRESGE